MLNNKLLQVFSIMLVVASISLHAQDFVRDKSISNIQKTTIPKGSLLINVFGEYPTFHKIYNPKSNEMIDLPDAVVRTEAYLNSELDYGVSEDINVFLNIPFKWINHYSPDLIQKNKGFGDIEVGGYLKLLGDNVNKSTLVSRFSVVAPVGENKNLDKTEFPLGEGVWQFEGGLSGMVFLGNWNLLYAADYILKTKNDAHVNLGDQIFAAVSLEKDMNTSYGNFTLESGFNVLNQFESSLNGMKINSSDSFAAQWFGGIAFYYLPGLRLSFSVPVTFYKRKAWFTDYSAILKFEYSLHLNN